MNSTRHESIESAVSKRIIQKLGSVANIQKMFLLEEGEGGDSL